MKKEEQGNAKMSQEKQGRRRAGGLTFTQTRGRVREEEKNYNGKNLGGMAGFCSGPAKKDS